MKRLLIVVDFQKDFVDGALGFSGALPLRERIAAKAVEVVMAGAIDLKKKFYDL